MKAYRPHRRLHLIICRACLQLWRKYAIIV